MNRILSLASWIALIFLPALGWRLQGLWGVAIGLVIGVMVFNWAHDWEVRDILRREREAKLAGRL